MGLTSAHAFETSLYCSFLSPLEWHAVHSISNFMGRGVTDSRDNSSLMRTELIVNCGSDSPFVAEWTSLMRQVDPDNQLFGPEWFTAWSETWGRIGRWTGQLDAIAVRDDEDCLQGVLCLGSLNIGPFRVRSCGGHSVPWRPLVAAKNREAQVGRAIGQYIVKSGWPLLQLGPVLCSDRTTEAMIETLREQRCFMQSRDSRLQATLRTPETFDEYVKETIGAKAFRKIRYYERRMEKSGPVEIRHFRQPDQEETLQLFESLKLIEANSWMSVREDAVPRFTNDDLRQFWHRLTQQHLAPHDHIDAWVMFQNAEPVSFCFTLTSGTVRFVIANNYAQSVRDHRTGSILFRYMLQDGMERGIRCFEFGDGNIEYKSQWGAKYGDRCDTYAVVPNRLFGAVARVASLAISKSEPEPVQV